MIDRKLDQRAKLKPDDIMHLHEYDLHLKVNHIYLMSVDRGYEVVEGGEETGIDFVIANRFIRNMNLVMRDNDRPIIIHMKTNGGSWEEGMAIYDMIKACPNPVTILNYTHARSMSSIILQAADKAVMMPNSHFMFHDGNLYVDGTVKQVESYVDFNKLATKTMMDIYSRAMNQRIGQGIQDAKKWLRSEMNKKEDVFLSAQQTVAKGLADEVFDYNWEKLTIYTDEQLSR